MARKFFYVCAGVLCLSLAFHFGYTAARAQAGSNVVGMSVSFPRMFVMAPNGELYSRGVAGDGTLEPGSTVFAGNFWIGGPTPAQRETWGQLKSRYAPKGGTAKPGAQGR